MYRYRMRTRTAVDGVCGDTQMMFANIEEGCQQQLGGERQIDDGGEGNARQAVSPRSRHVRRRLARRHAGARVARRVVAGLACAASNSSISVAVVGSSTSSTAPASSRTRNLTIISCHA